MYAAAAQGGSCTLSPAYRAKYGDEIPQYDKHFYGATPDICLRDDPRCNWRVRAGARAFLIRLGDWVWQILHGYLGTSIFTNLPVAAMIAQRVERTLSLLTVTLVFAACIAVPIGMVATWKWAPLYARPARRLAQANHVAPQKSGRERTKLRSWP
jgi:ABC-type dipeptide/oligopeptide/nickel transport system permease component